MAGRKARLYDIVEKKWIDFDDLLTAENFWKDREQNPFITTGGYSGSRYSWNEPVNTLELATIAVGGKPKKTDSVASRAYMELNPNVDLEAGLNRVGINPIWDRDYNFIRHPEWRPTEKKPIWYPLYGEYWGINDNGEFTNNIAANRIGSSERRALQAESKDKDEELRSWLSEYYNYLEGGINAMSPEAYESYSNYYADTNANMIAKKPSYDPSSPHVVKGRALTSIALKGAIENYIGILEDNLRTLENEKEKTPEIQKSINDLRAYIEKLKLLSGISNTDLAKLSEKNEFVSRLFEDMINYYMLQYYGNVAKLYKDDPTNIGLDIEKYGDYAKMKESIPQQIAELKKDKPWYTRAGLTMFGLISSLGNSMVNNLGVLLRNTFDSDEIANEQRDRANAVINTISDRIVNRNTAQYNGNIDEAVETFDELASSLYVYYKEHDLDNEGVYTKKLKRDLLIKYQVQASTVGEELAQLNLLRELQNKDYDEQGTIKRLGYTANNLFNTLGTTVFHIADMAWYTPQAVWDIVQAGKQALFDGENFWDALGNELTDTWHRALNNDLVNYLANVESTGTWLTTDINPLGTSILRSQEYYKNRGIAANPILRRYGEENDLWAWSTLYDIVPVTGYMMGSAGGAKVFNLIGKAMRGVSTGTRTLSRNAKVASLLSDGAYSTGYNTLSVGSNITSKFLGGTATFIDATAPAMATAGMDYGYAKNNYDQAMEQAEQYINSDEFMLSVNDRINSERGIPLIEGTTSINSSLEDKAFFVLQDANFNNTALQLMQQHNENLSYGQKPWTIEDAAKEIILKPYKDEYLQETQKIATFNAGVTFGLTILPDIHMTNTWRKAMFSSSSRGAMNDMKAHLRKWIGMKPKPQETYIKGIYKKDGKWFVDGKPMTKKDLAKIYIDQSKAGFVSNYLQDIGVAAGQGLQEEMLNQYIDLRFGEDAVNGISYNMDQVWFAAADRAGLAFGEKTSFRDGLYGALAPWVLSPMHGIGETYSNIKQAGLQGTKSFSKALLKEILFKNSLLYNLSPWGSKEILAKENKRRAMLHTTIENWINTNGQNFMDNIGSLLELSKQEKAAVKLDNYIAFQDSRIGQTVQTAIMLSLILNFLPIKSTIMAYMQDRANRKEVNQSDIDRLNNVVVELTSRLLTELPAEAEQRVQQYIQDVARNEGREATAEEINKYREQVTQELTLQYISNEGIAAEDRSIVHDLMEIRKLGQDMQAKDSRTEYQQLNDLRENAQIMLDLIDKSNMYYAEAESKFGDTADLVVKQEYARLRMYQDYLQKDVLKKSKLLKNIENLFIYNEADKNAESTIALNDASALFISEFGGSYDKLSEAIAITRRRLPQVNNDISKTKSEINKIKAKNPKDNKEQATKDSDLLVLNAVLKLLELQKNELTQKWMQLQQIKKEYDRQNKEESENKHTPIIAAKDIMRLSEGARYGLLTSKKLSKAQQAEVDKFNAAASFANDADVTDVSSYLDLLGAKLYNQNALIRTSFEGQLTPEAIQRLNERVLQCRIDNARMYYAKQFESFADESQYRLRTEPNLVQREVVDENTGEVTTVFEHNASQPEITVTVEEQAAYERFLEAYQNKMKEINTEENAAELKLGLEKALKDADNSLYKKMIENEKQNRKAISDLNQYVDPEVFNKEERRELVNIIEFATVHKSIEADNIMLTLSQQNDTFMKELSKFLSDRGFTPGTIEDLRGRILQYNHNITDTIEKNKKAEEERTKKQEEKPEVKETREQAAKKRFVSTVNAVSSYTMAEQDASKTPMRELLKALGIQNAYNLKVYSDNLLEVFRLIIVKSEAQTVEEMDKALDDNFKSITEDANTQLLDSELQELSLLVDALKNEYHRRIGSFKIFNTTSPPPNNGGNGGNTGTGDSGKNRRLSVNTGAPYALELVRWAWNLPIEKQSYMVKNYIVPANIDEFFRYFTTTGKTNVVFISSNDWADKTADEINAKAREKQNEDIAYNDNDARPVLAAVEIPEAREGSVSIDGKHYQVIGMLPSTAKASNTAIVRGNAIRFKPTHNDPYIVTQEITKDGNTTREPLSTTMSAPKPQSNQLDIDKGPQPINVPPNTILTASHFTAINEEGNPVKEGEHAVGAKTNLTPSSNKTDTNRANWPTILILELDATLNENGNTLADLEGEDVINFNSRTKGFAETLQSIIDIIKANPANFSGYTKSLNLSTEDAASRKSNTSLNSKIADESNRVALAAYISLANGYDYYINLKNGDVNLAVLHNKKAVKQWNIMSANAENVVTADLIIKDLSILKYKNSEGLDIGVGKWQVSWGNFNFANNKGAEYKNIYVKQALRDGILYAYDIVPTEYNIEIDAVKDLFAEQQLELQNREAEKRAAQAVIDSKVDPVTGEPNAGIDIEGYIAKIQGNNELDGETKDRIALALNRIAAIRDRVNASRREAKTLSINQLKSRKSTTGTTALVSGRTGDQGKASKPLVVSAIGGNVVDRSIRDYFNPKLRGKVNKESFVELFKDVFNEATIENLWDAIENLNKTFVLNGWDVISTGIYTIDESLNDKQVGEIDLLALDAMGNPHIIDIKTYSNQFNLVIEGSKGHNYPAQVSMYRADIMRNVDLFVPEGNLHIFALKLDMDANFYDMTTDSEGVNTITKKKSKASKIQIKKGARFEQHDVLYIGDQRVNDLLDLRALNGTITSTNTTVDTAAEEAEAQRLKEELEAKKKAAAEELSGENELTPEELEELTRQAQEKANQSLSLNDYLTNRSKDLLEDLACRGLK